MEQRRHEPQSIGKFTAHTEGLFVDNGGTAKRISDAIWHIGNAVRDDGGGAADIVGFVDRNGASREIVIPHKDSVLRAGKMLEYLVDQNFAVPEAKADRALLASYLAELRQSQSRKFLLVRRMGWHGASFVIGADVISADAAVGIRLDGPLSRVIEKFGQGGLLPEYQKRVLLRARYSSRLMLGVALALLAPLARIISLENGGINIVGKPGVGKTTLLRVIGSFYGGGPVAYINSWLMTDNAPETLGITHCDLPLLLDELATLEPDPQKAGGRLKAIVHRLALGQGKSTSHRAQSDDRGPTDFHVIYASTSEHRLPDFMREGCSEVTGGQVARFVDVPANPGRGRLIFEYLPRRRAKLARQASKRVAPHKYLQRINKACQSNYGVAGRVYLEHIVQDRRTNPGELEAFLAKEMDIFENEVANDPHVDARIRRRFAALYAAGQLGLRYKIVPRKCDRFMDTIGACYRDAVALLAPPVPVSDTEAIDTLAGFLRSHRKELLKPDGKHPLTTQSYRTALGVRPSTKRHGNCVWLKTPAFRELFANFHEAVAKRLVAVGIIRVDKKGHMTQQQRIPGLGTKEYFYVIDRVKLRAARKPRTNRQT